MDQSDKQRLFPIRLKAEIKPEDLAPENALPEIPQILLDTINENGFCVGNTTTNEIHCQYVYSDEKAQELEESTGGIHPHPIYQIDPKAAENKTELYNLNVRLIAGPPQENKHWHKIQTLKEILKEEKLRKKEEITKELSQIPRTDIWKGFRSDRFEDGTHTELTGYRVGKNAKKWWMEGIGNPWAKIWIIGLYPSTEELKHGKVYAGGSGIELNEIVKSCGLNPETDVYMDNLLKKYMPSKSKMGAEVKMEQMWLLRRQLSYYQPERVICLGAESFKEIAGSKYKFGTNRGTWIDTTYPLRAPEDGFKPWAGRLAGTFHPAGCLRPEGRKNLPLFRTDMQDLILDREHQDVQPNNEEIRTIEEVKSWAKLEKTMLDQLKKDEYIIYALDTEGYGALPTQDMFVSMQFCPVLCKVSKNPQNHQEALKGSWIQAPKIDIIPMMASIDTTTLLFREHQDPERISKEAFLFSKEAQTLQTQLFEENSGEFFGEDPEEEPIEKEPFFTVAESDEAYNEIFAKHQEKRPDSDLIIFRPDKTKPHLAGHEEEIGEILDDLSKHPKVAGFCLTNANFDRIRMETSLKKDILKNGAIYASPLDTMIGEHVTDENNDLGLKPSLNKRFGWARQDKALDTFAKEYKLDDLCQKVKSTPRASAWSLYPWSLLKAYAAKDVYGCGALLVEEFKDMMAQEKEHQPERLEAGESNTLRQAFYISCGALNGTYEMHREGMPVGEKGLEILQQLTSFYGKHEKKLVKEYQEMVYGLTGLHNANPSSTEELSYILFNERSPLARRGIEPWKESGNKGRLWEDIPEDERKSCKTSTDAESLEIIASSCQDKDIQQFLVRLAEIKTILTIREDFLPDLSYGISKSKGIVGRLNLDTLKLHTSYTPTLDTARCRSVPNLSTFPKGEEKRVKKILGEAPPFKIREIVCAPEGTFLLNRDWMTAEVLALGYLSGDENMRLIISKMSEGLDFHCKLAIPSYPIIKETIPLIGEHKTPPIDWLNANMPQEKQKDFIKNWVEFTTERTISGHSGALTEGESHQMAKILFKQERSNIKPVTFGVPYGRSAKAIQKQLNREYYINDIRGPDGNIIHVTEAEAQAMIDSYKITEFHEAWAYLEDQARQGVENGILKDPWGYIRHFPKGMKPDEVSRKSYNYQIQHLVAAVMNMAMADWIRRREQHQLKSFSYATLYDNIGWVTYEDELQEVWDISQTVMTTERPIGPKDGPNPEMANWHFPTDGEFSLTWEGKTIKPEELGVDPKPHRNLTGLE